MRICKTGIHGIGLLAALSMCTALAISCAGSSSISVSLDGQWKIILGDDPSCRRPGYDDSARDTVELPGTFMPYVAAKKPGLAGTLWLRKSVVIPKYLHDRDLGLCLGRIANADETYFNGEKIGATGEFPPDGHSMWNHPRYYMIPHSIVREGPNVISVRVSYNTYGEVLGRLSITDLKTWGKSRDLSYFYLIVFSYIIIAMGIPLFVISLLHFIRQRGESQEYLYYCLQLLCGLFVILDHSTSWNMYGSMMTRFRVLGFAWAALNVTHPIFLHRIYGLKRKKIEALLWTYLAVVVFTGMLFTDMETLRPLGLLLIVVTTSLGFYNASCHIYALYAGKPLARLFSFFGLMVILGAIHDGFVYFFKFAFIPAPPFFQHMIFYFTAITLYLGTALIMVTRYVSIRDDMDSVNTRLAGYLDEYSRLNEEYRESKMSRRRNYPVNIEKAGEKIEKAVDYIKGNYREDLSREGLAALVDIHPDNLGRMFKIVTGKKMGDYINELRIRDSAEQIAGSEENIIHIAFSVGFDSLRTFNRVFLKVMHMTPDAYRKKHRSVKKAE